MGFGLPGSPGRHAAAVSRLSFCRARCYIAQLDKVRQRVSGDFDLLPRGWRQKRLTGEVKPGLLGTRPLKPFAEAALAEGRFDPGETARLKRINKHDTHVSTSGGKAS